MELFLRRSDLTERATVGTLYLDETLECFTLEDAVRTDGQKVPGKTAIPAGRYELDIAYSVRFATMLPILKNVPGFSGIRIHAGNTAQDTEGCILVGLTRGIDSVWNSRLALDRLIKKLAHRVPTWITISNPEPEGVSRVARTT